MKLPISPIWNVSLLQALVKGLEVFYFVLLPVFYAEKIITAEGLGIIGAACIVMVIFGALVVARFLHNLPTKKLLQLSSLITIFASCILLVGATHKIVDSLFIAYSIMGIATGTAMSAITALSAQITTRGERYTAFAKIGTLQDVVRIILPVVVSGTVLLGNSSTAILLIIVAAIFLFFLASLLPSEPATEIVSTMDISERIRTNKNFLYIMSLEFFDSFSSAQLFIFVPLLFLAKGYTLANSLLLQSAIFVGYITGRWFVSILAKRSSGIRAVSYAEIGMSLTIIFLLIVQNLWVLYFLTFLLGIFVRGTSPTIKALALDTLTEQQMKKGSAIHVVAGDSGGALGQLIFGYFVAWFGANSPFIAAAIITAIIGVVIFIKPIRINKIELA